VVGFESQALVRDAVASVVVKRARDRARFDDAFDGFFAREPRRTLWERLAAEGFSDAELDVVRELLDAFASAAPDSALGPLVHRGAELDRLLQLAGSAQMLDSMQSALQAGFYTHRLLEHVGTWRAQDELTSLRVRLVDALGEVRADALVAALKREIQRAAEDVRSFVKSTLARRDADAEQGEDLLEVLGRAQRKDRLALEIAHRLGGGSLRLLHDARLVRRVQRVEAHPSGRRQRKAPHGRDDAIEFEGPQGASVHDDRSTACDSKRKVVGMIPGRPPTTGRGNLLR
jgi:uncharacterized protein with von Willebrand factor type A (vWA) domain